MSLHRWFIAALLAAEAVWIGTLACMFLRAVT